MRKILLFKLNSLLFYDCDYIQNIQTILKTRKSRDRNSTTAKEVLTTQGQSKANRQDRNMFDSLWQVYTI